MDKSVKAALLSALVIPGAGHLYLKKYIFGAVLGCASILALYLIVSNIMEQAKEIFEKVERGELSPNVAEISELLSRQAGGNESQLFDLAWPVLIICWLIGIVDSYRRGRVQESEN